MEREDPRATPGRNLEMDLDLTPHSQTQRTELPPPCPKCSAIVWPQKSPVASEKPVGIARTWDSKDSYSQAVRVRRTVMGHSGP